MNKIAILLPIYYNDNPNYVKESIESILNQSYPNFQLIILIDGPLTNALNNTLNHYTNRNITQLRFEINRGLAAVLNDGINYGFDQNYNFFARMDADDIAIPDRLEKQINFLIQHPEVDVVGGAIEEIDENGKLKNKIIYYPLTHDACYHFFSKRDPVAHPAVLFRKSFFEKAGFYNEHYRKNQDTILWYQGFKNGCIFANLPDVVLKFRTTFDFYNQRRSGLKRAITMTKDRFKINKYLKYGLKGNIFAILSFILTIAPVWLKKFAYKKLR